MAISVGRKQTLKSAAIVSAPIVGLIVFWAINFGVRSLHTVNRLRAEQAYSEIRGVDLAVTKMLTDTGVRTVREMLEHPETIDLGSDKQVLETHTEVIYDLLRHGKHASVELDPEARRRLGDRYMDLDRDPWGARHVFYIPHGGSVSNALRNRIAQSYNKHTLRAEPNAAGQGSSIVAISRGKDGKLACLDSGGATDPSDDISNVDTEQLSLEAYN